MKSAKSLAVFENEDSNVLDNISDARGFARSCFVLTSDLKHFIDMVYLYATQKSFLPSYVSRKEFKSAIDDMRRFEIAEDVGNGSSGVRIVTSPNAYTYALIVYGFVKELAAAGNHDASRAYDVLKQLMPYKIC
jgi:hypothetical protein